MGDNALPVCRNSSSYLNCGCGVCYIRLEKCPTRIVSYKKRRAKCLRQEKSSLCMFRRNGVVVYGADGENNAVNGRVH